MDDVINRIFADCKGILAADESSPTIKKRLESVGKESTAETRHSYRHNLFSTEGLGKYIGGVILFEETLKTPETIDPLKDQGIVLGVKVDKGTSPYDEKGGKLTNGLDTLLERLHEYKGLGAEFAKWRAVTSVTDSDACMLANSSALARYAKVCQYEGLIPIVEPEVLMDGEHDIYNSFEVTEKVIHFLFDALYHEGVNIEKIILKPNMIMHGYKNTFASSSEDIALATLNCFKKCVPAAVPAIAFLSGGQPDNLAIRSLETMNKEEYLPWTLSFSFGRTMQSGALKMWGENKMEDARSWTFDRARECSKATGGNKFLEWN